MFSTNHKTNYMEKQLINIPGYGVYQYLLVMNPHEELRNQVLAVKKEFAEKYKAPSALHTRPDVPLVSFFAYQMTQERIVSRIGNIARGISPFKVELNGFGSFPTHTIYMNVTSKLPVQGLIKELQSATALITLNKEHKPLFMEAFHVTVCRKLKPWQFEQAWLEYAHRHFSGRFIADSLLLLRRSVNEKTYQLIMRFEFQNLSVGIKQGNLFM
jgi:2'-5' RNA ligase